MTCEFLYVGNFSPINKNMVSNTTESKYVVVSPLPSFDGGAEAAKASNAMEEKYATETPDDT